MIALEHSQKSENMPANDAKADKESYHYLGSNQR